MKRSVHLSSVYTAFLAHTTSRQRVNNGVYANGTCRSASYIRIPRFVVEASIESGSRHRLLFMAVPDPLLAVDNFSFLFFSTSTRLFSSQPYPTTFLFAASLSSSLLRGSIPPFPLSTTRRFLRQVLCTYINSSSVNLRVPRHSFRGNRLVTRLRRAKQSSKHGETFVLVETRRISAARPATTFTFTAFRT